MVKWRHFKNTKLTETKNVIPKIKTSLSSAKSKLDILVKINTKTYTLGKRKQKEKKMGKK